MQAAAGADGRLPMLDLSEWDTFPFEGEMRVKPLEPPADEPPRFGEGGKECWRCERGDSDAIWSDDYWILAPRYERGGLPVVVLLEPREHVDIEDLPEERAADLGRLILRIERAIMQVEGIGRVHVGRWGEGGAHFHVWFMGRPARLNQLRSSFAAIWDDVLPPTPESVWQENLAVIAKALATSGGRSHV